MPRTDLILSDLTAVSAELAQKQHALRRNLMERAFPMQRHVETPLPPFMTLNDPARAELGIMPHSPAVARRLARLTAPLVEQIRIPGDQSVELAAGTKMNSIPQLGIVQTDERLLAVLDRAELQSIEAHEFQHLNHRDVSETVVAAAQTAAAAYKAVQDHDDGGTVTTAVDGIITQCRTLADLMELDADAAGVAATSPHIYERALQKVGCITFGLPQGTPFSQLCIASQAIIRQTEYQASHPCSLATIRTRYSLDQRYQAIQAYKAMGQAVTGLAMEHLTAISMIGATVPAPERPLAGLMRA